MDIKRVEIFRCGRWNNVRTFTEADLDAMVESFTELSMSGRAPLKFGHNDEQPLTDGQPALGWISRVWREGEVLFADFTSMPRIVFDAVKAGMYKNVSIELMRDVISDGKEYPWVVSGVALLGADIPAVTGLKDLATLTMARPATFLDGTRMTFTTGGRQTMTDAELLKAENKRLNALLLQQAQDNAITSRQCLPAERERFKRRYGDDGTLSDWTEWLRGAPRPPSVHMTRTPTGNGNADMKADQDLAPDVQVRELVAAEVEKSGGTLTFRAATTRVLLRDRDLAERYRMMPGVK